MAEVYDALFAILFAQRCPRCTATARHRYCAACRAEFERVHDPCPACGLMRPVARCPRRGSRWEVDAVLAPFDYAPPLSTELLRLKSERGRRLGRALGLLLAESLAERTADIDVIVPVPLHPSRLRRRGFNQATEIARAVAAATRIPLEPHGARRLATRPQAGLDASRRASNLHRGFQVTRSFAGSRVAIVDDVLTTGATVNALGAALRARGAARVDAWAVARTPSPRH